MKKLAKVLALLFAVYWLLLAHVSLNFLDAPPPLGEVSKNGNYKIVLKDMYPVNPMGLYCLLTTDWSPIYFTLYDRNGYIGQSSPFICYGAWSGADTLFPGEAVNLDKNSFLVLDDEYNGNLISAPKINDGGVGGSGSFIDAPSGCLFRFRGVSVMSARARS